MPTFDANILPNNSGKDLGSPSQRWDGFFQNLDVSGTTNITVANPVLPNPIERNLTGDVTGNVTGNVTGDVTGNVTGNLTGAVTGNVTGNLTGNVTGNVTGDVTSTGTSTIKNLNGTRVSNLFTDVQAAVADIGSASGDVEVPTSQTNFATGITNPSTGGLSIFGVGRNASKISYTGTGIALSSALGGVEGNLTVQDLWIHGNSAASNPVVKITNDNVNTSSQFFFQRLKVDGGNAAQAGIELDAGSAGSGANVYNISLIDVWSHQNGYALKMTGATGIPLVTAVGGQFSAGTNGFLLTRSGGAGASSIIHSLNLFGTNVQGNTEGIKVSDAYGRINAIGAYFEQTTSSPCIGQDTNGSISGIILGCNLGSHSSSNYACDFASNGATNSGIIAMVNSVNAAAVAAYNIANTNGSLMGFGDSFSVVNCPAHYDWTVNTYQDLFAWDKVNRTFTASTGASISSGTPKIGFGPKGDAVAAYLHVKPTGAPATTTGSGAAGTDVLVVDGSSFRAQATTGTTGQTGGKGGGITLRAQDGGTAPSGSSNGLGGDITIRSGAAGNGAGSANEEGIIYLLTGSSGTGLRVRSSVSASTPRVDITSANSGTKPILALVGTGTGANTYSFRIDTSGHLNLTQSGSGNLVLGAAPIINNIAAPTAAANQISLGSTTATTVGAAGGASALPATPTGYWIINVAGTAMKVPYYTS